MTAAFNALALPLNWLLNRLLPVPDMTVCIQALEAMNARREREKVNEALRRGAPAAN